MSKCPKVDFYTSDFLASTILWSNEQKGAYITLLCLQHQQGHLTKSTLDRISNGDEEVLSKFIEDDDGKYYNERMQFETEKQFAYSKSRSENRKKTYEKDMNNICESYEKDVSDISEDICGSYEKHMGNGSGNGNGNGNNYIEENDINNKSYSCPYTKIKDMFNVICKDLPNIRGIEGKRRVAVTARWNDCQDLEVFRTLFTKTAESTFLNGGGSQGFKADFDWLMIAGNFNKVLEGKYDNREEPKPQQKPKRENELSDDFIDDWVKLAEERGMRYAGTK